ncbi:MAG: MFS transporter, partial [Clostridia bacterium]|nr:MFS transporter [Clostridia bacterium]
FLSPFWGEFFKNHRFKPYMLLGCTIIGGCMYAYSLAQNVYHFYIIAAIKGIFSGMLTGVPVSRILSNWFIEKRGLAMGIALAGSGLAGSAMTPIVSATVEANGWRAGFVQLAVVFFAITVPVIAILIKEKPEDMGLKPLGWENAAQNAALAAAADKSYGMTRAQAIKSRTYWCYVIALSLSSACGMGIQNNIIGHLTGNGFDAAYAARIFSVSMLVLVPGKIVLGRVYDKVGIKFATIYLTVGLSASALLLAYGTKHPMPFVFAVIFGFANAIQTMQMPYITGRIFGEREYTRIYGICQPFVSIGSALGVPLSATVYDLTGSYVPGFLAMAVGGMIIMVLMVSAVTFSSRELEEFSAINKAEDAKKAAA